MEYSPDTEQYFYDIDMSSWTPADLSIIPEGYDQYAFTIKYNRGKAENVTFENYSNIIETFRMFGTIRRLVHEYGETKRLHLHGVVLLPKGFFRKRITNYNFMHIKLVEIYDVHGWEYYLDKDNRVDWRQHFREVVY